MTAMAQFAIGGIWLPCKIFLLHQALVFLMSFMSLILGVCLEMSPWKTEVEQSAVDSLSVEGAGISSLSELDINPSFPLIIIFLQYLSFYLFILKTVHINKVGLPITCCQNGTPIPRLLFVTAGVE